MCKDIPAVRADRAQSLAERVAALMARTLPLTLNRDQVMLLADRTLNSDVGTPDLPVVAPRLLVKLASLYLELVTPDSTVQREGTIAVTEPEAWLLRSKVQSGDRVSSDALFGVRLLRQLYALLIEFDADVDGIPVADGDGEKWDAWHQDAYALWAKKETKDDDLQPA